ncbi:hypothetical protein TKV_c20810 [Thermoanaerobacter kivui]|uniref:Iron-only hydrogenase system regulator n=1 Tax=Thermoanaerobacter kivui TaxID=2325 RepID=A0A097ATS4_THEKI|nr:hypothetical protein [Thermoanaerobacter kivui]AIS53214.1 hypothetical protein TKV_c20810 [Thermoanaerobacter kivui]
MNIYVMGISVEKRSEFGPKVQEILTRHGDRIIARFGIHDAENGSGLITLNVRGEEKFMEELAEELSAIPTVTVKYMSLK